MINNLYDLFAKVREVKPLVHHITNYVTVNDCANVTLEIGASPVMADAIGEAGDIASISGALVLNIGTLNENTIPAMIAAGISANAKGIPVVFDPVGAGASKMRNDTVSLITSKVKISVLRGNISEIKFVAGLCSTTKGVDASEDDITEIDQAGEIALKLAQRYNCVVVISGDVDVISDGQKVVNVLNGHPLLGNQTGTGCMCSSLIGSFCGVVPNQPFEASIFAMLCMGIAGEIAYEKARNLGNGNFRVALHDAISKMDIETLSKKAKFHEK